MKVMREIVFDVLGREREYQIEKWGEGDASVAEFLVYMQDYLTEAFKQRTRYSHEDTLHTIRKITAMGVACMEQWGAPDRAITDPARLLPASPIEDEALDAALPEPPSADPGRGVAEPPAEIYPGWVELAAQEATECDETCPTDCSVREPVVKAIYDAYIRGFTEGDRADQGLEDEECPF